MGNPYQTALAGQGVKKNLFWCKKKPFPSFQHAGSLPRHPGPLRPFGKGFPQSGSRKRFFYTKKGFFLHPPSAHRTGSPGGSASGWPAGRQPSGQKGFFTPFGSKKFFLHLSRSPGLGTHCIETSNLRLSLMFWPPASKRKYND